MVYFFVVAAQYISLAKLYYLLSIFFNCSFDIALYFSCISVLGPDFYYCLPNYLAQHVINLIRT